MTGMMKEAPVQLQDVAKELEEGRAPKAAVRTLLSWFGSQRRGQWVAHRIHETLARLQLDTVPDFRNAHIDAEVTFVKMAPEKSEVRSGLAEVDAGVASAIEAVDPIQRLSLLIDPNRPPTSVTPDTSVEAATTIMMLRDYSQLPVVNNKKVLGLFSWETYGQARVLGKECLQVQQCMDRNPLLLEPETPLLDAVERIAKKGAAIVHARGQLYGIVTTSDLALIFHKRTGVFVLLESIENHLRAIVSRLGIEYLEGIRHPEAAARPLNDVHGLTFGDYIRALQNPDKWNELGIPLDRFWFLEELERIRETRNDAMHFSPDPLDAEEIERLSTFLRVLQLLSEREQDRAGLNRA